MFRGSSTVLELVEDFLAQLPQTDAALVLTEWAKEKEDEEEEVEDSILVLKPRVKLTQELNEELSNGQLEHVSGIKDHEGKFSEWHKMTSLKYAEIEECVVLHPGTKAFRVKNLLPDDPRKLPDRRNSITKMAELPARNLLPPVTIPDLEFLPITEVHSSDTSVGHSKPNIAVDEEVPNKLDMEIVEEGNQEFEPVPGRQGILCQGRESRGARYQGPPHSCESRGHLREGVSQRLHDHCRRPPEVQTGRGGVRLFGQHIPGTLQPRLRDQPAEEGS